MGFPLSCPAPSPLNPNNFNDKWLNDWLNDDITSNDPPHNIKAPSPSFPTRLYWKSNGYWLAPPILIPSLDQIGYGRQNPPTPRSNPPTNRATWQSGDAGGRRSPSSARRACPPPTCPAPGARGRCWDSASCLYLSPSAAAPRWCPSGPRRRADQRQRARWRPGWGSTSSRGSSSCTHASSLDTCSPSRTDLERKNDKSKDKAENQKAWWISLQRLQSGIYS